MKKRRRKKNQAGIVITAVVLLVLVILAALKLKNEGPKEEQMQEELQMPESEGPKEEETADPQGEKPETEAPEIEEEEPEEKEPQSEEEALETFLPDYTSAPLLSTTPIKGLSMEVGATEKEVHFNWFSPSAAKGKVSWKQAETGEVQIFEAKSTPSVTVPGYYVNKAKVTDLQPGTNYLYQVGNDDAWSPEYSYKAPKETGDNLTFLVTADAQIGQSQFEEIEATTKRWNSVVTRLTDYVPNAKFLFHLGDQVADFGNAEHYDLFLDQLPLYGIPLAPLVGNHDVANEETIEKTGRPGGPYFYEHFYVPNRSDVAQSQFDQDGNYFFVRNKVLFIVLNSSTHQPPEVHEAYVAQVVAENPDVNWRILAQHYPAYAGRRNARNDNSKEYLARIADANKIDLVLGAHDHVYSRSAFINGLCESYNDYPYKRGVAITNPEGTMYVTCSTSSGCLYHVAEKEMRHVVNGQPQAPMALRIDITKEELHLRAYLVDSWTVYDEYTIRKE